MFEKMIEGLMMLPFLLCCSVSAVAQTKLETAIFAGGCFWCLEPPFEKLDGVAEVVSGYTGGEKVDPTYEEVSSGKTGHREAIRVTYDPAKVGYEELLDIFWRHIDPTDDQGQFADKGSQYQTAIYYQNEEQKELAEESKRRLDKSGFFGSPIVVELVPAKPFYLAEEYHQDYYKKSTQNYERYKEGSGRASFLDKLWKRPDAPKPLGKSCPLPRRNKTDLKSNLTPLQYHVTQEGGTERPFENEYWNEKREGIYVDRVTGEALFSSKDKFDSGTGWPSFTKPLHSEMIVKKIDTSHFTTRTEVLGKSGHTHLGHVFDDGPGPTGQRFCINSASLRFIPKEELEKEGYGDYVKLFEKGK